MANTAKTCFNEIILISRKIVGGHSHRFLSFVKLVFLALFNQRTMAVQMEASKEGGRMGRDGDEELTFGHLKYLLCLCSFRSIKKEKRK